jgi:3-dehydroquinate dehydratase-2
VSRSARVAVLHGVNLDQLGLRDHAHYGALTLTELEQQIAGYAAELSLRADFFHTNAEGDFVERLHRCRADADAIVLNPGAWTHYSWAIRDALEISGCPAVEVHLSDVKARESWRAHSVIADLCIATVAGEREPGYRRALAILRDHLDSGRTSP